MKNVTVIKHAYSQWVYLNYFSYNIDVKIIEGFKVFFKEIFCS